MLESIRETISYTIPQETLVHSHLSSLIHCGLILALKSGFGVYELISTQKKKGNKKVMSQPFFWGVVVVSLLVKNKATWMCLEELRSEAKGPSVALVLIEQPCGASRGKHLHSVHGFRPTCSLTQDPRHRMFAYVPHKQCLSVLCPVNNVYQYCAP